MSIIAMVSGLSSVLQQVSSPGITSIPKATTFSQELDAQTGSVTAHHHHGGGSQSVTSSLAGVASAAGSTSPETIAASLEHLLT
jgi:predicted aconitase with swiveling domain